MKRQSKETHNEEFSYTGLDELFISENMNNYNQFIVASAMKYFKEDDNIVDFGAGIGSLAMIFRDRFSKTVLCIEIDKVNQRYLKERNLFFHKNLNELQGKVDAIFSSNVLEHILNDVEILQKMKSQLKEGGTIFLYLPAKQVLWSELDSAVGHYRRYEKRELRDKCALAGLDVVLIEYADSIGFFASLLMKYVGYNPKNGIGSARSLLFYDKYIFHFSRFLDKLLLKHFFGKNIILVAKNNSCTSPE